MAEWLHFIFFNLCLTERIRISAWGRLDLYKGYKPTRRTINPILLKVAAVLVCKQQLADGLFCFNPRLADKYQHSESFWMSQKRDFRMASCMRHWRAIQKIAWSQKMFSKPSGQCRKHRGSKVMKTIHINLTPDNLHSNKRCNLVIFYLRCRVA